MNATTGKLAWNKPYSTGQKIESNPVVYQDTAYICTDGGKLYALTTATGIPQRRWHDPFLTGTPGYCSVVVDNNSGTVFVGGTSGLIHALTPTRRPAWHHPFHTRGAILAMSQVSRSNILYVASDDGKIYALNASTGEQRWARAISSLYQSVPTANGDSLYVGSEAGDVYILNAYTGTIERTCRIGGQVRSTPRQVNGILYVGSSDHKVYRLNPAAGCNAR